MADLSTTYTNAPNIVVTLSNVEAINIGTQKNLAFGEVVSIYLNCYLYSIGDILLYDTEGQIRYTQNNITYFIISTDSVKLAYRSGGLS